MSRRHCVLFYIKRKIQNFIVKLRTITFATVTTVMNWCDKFKGNFFIVSKAISISPSSLVLRFIAFFLNTAVEVKTCDFKSREKTNDESFRSSETGYDTHAIRQTAHYIVVDWCEEHELMHFNAKYTRIYSTFIVAQKKTSSSSSHQLATHGELTKFRELHRGDWQRDQLSITQKCRCLSTAPKVIQTTKKRW